MGIKFDQRELNESAVVVNIRYSRLSTVVLSETALGESGLKGTLVTWLLTRLVLLDAQCGRLYLGRAR